MTNTASDTITGYAEAPDGQLELLHADGVSATTDAGPIDLAAAPGGRQVFELNGLAGDLGVYAVASDGTLTRIATVHGLPAFDGSTVWRDRGHRARLGAPRRISGEARPCRCFHVHATPRSTANSARSNSAPAPPPGTAPNTPRAPPRSNSATSKNANSPSKPNWPTNVSSRTGKPPQPGGMVRVPHRARISKAVKRHSSAAGNSPRTCALAGGHPHQPQPSHAARNPSTQPLTFMRRSDIGRQQRGAPRRRPSDAAPDRSDVPAFPRPRVRAAGRRGTDPQTR